ncbi:MAG TPA: hypothetical protein VI818_01185 [Candidatus Thermoplasmatota archaeon]|nr:hypothetical protein [Candidatus Thermoplasmatota archaeon]
MVNPPRPDEPKVVVGAILRINGDVSFEAMPRVEALVEVGRPLHIGLHFRFEEASRQAESSRLRVASTVGGQTPPPVERRFGDAPLVTDSRFGLIIQPFRFARAGVYEGVFRAHAEYLSRPWLGREEPTQKQETIEVPLRVQVR